MTAQPRMTEKDLHKALFLNLTMMLSASAMQQMGKLVDPAKGKAETNLEGAQVTIDMLSMLQAKTLNNLDPEEKRMIDHTVSSLQMTYVETAEAQKANPPQPEAKAKAPSAETPPSPEPEIKTTGKTDREVKYHKTYG
ncbi:MAG: hypothetical protein A2498_04880 [Lentisphaerae bacterium RIFOXYC12_FULL_60_16]|nr:MAG: hypothetical protein A2498_04880 [Lentisphaerae bacterium RIFOXYC12_FULL_60_16]OGV69255.1 MAG: hypothetical protein A2269_06805 [Lentisphaerae bacterium RIFOXYA12_FULL_60_10]OGV86711.1 MAG: hypothetical protein A2340_10550 [Lentisphaerae bacterium RIFOXYB12_FULL_60_10]